jgi:1-phosphatidylinositol-4-phosphate 5-kinase
MRVVEYAPTVFEYLRMLDGIDLKIVEASLSVNKNLAGIQQLTESLGRSGSFFFFSHDRRFILKTIGESEQRFLIKILSAYTDFIRKNPKSLLARIYGCFTVRIDSVAPINLLFMENTFHRIPEPDMVFDLKGSLLGRKTHNPNFGKDLDLLESENVLINMNHIWRTQIIEQIKCDSEFL